MMLFPPSWHDGPPDPPECPRCGGPPDRAHDCVDPATVPKAPKVTPRPERPEERARRLLRR